MFPAFPLPTRTVAGLSGRFESDHWVILGSVPPYTQAMRYLLSIVVTALLVGGGMYYWQSQQSSSGGPAAGGPGFPGGFGGGQAPLVGATPVSRELIYDTVQAIGTAQANESLTVTAKVTDTVRAVDFDDGLALAGFKFRDGLTQILMRVLKITKIE